MSLRDKLRVMVVDDMSTSRGLILQALDSFGLRGVSWAPDGAKALVALEKSPVHLVISDYNMPDMNGLDLLANLRRSKRLAKTGFILITGRPEQKIIDTGKKLGMNNYLPKPFENADLLKSIEAVVGRL